MKKNESARPKETSDTTSSETVTDGVRIRVIVRYSNERSQASRSQWVFDYTVTISNERTDAVQLVSRHWIITDGSNNVQEVRGLGVIGRQPTLAPGESFEYSSMCPLSTPFGSMEGRYQMVTADGDFFDAMIATFELSAPYTVH